MTDATSKFLMFPRPSSPERLGRWSRTLHDAYFARPRLDWRDRDTGDCDADGEWIIWNDVNFKKLLAKIEHRIEREKQRSGHEGGVFSAILDAFARSSAIEAAHLRNCIINLAIIGEMTPDEAERWAHRLGLRQIAKRNLRDLCDPMQEFEWSLLMAAVWIQWRELRFVARLTPDSPKFLPRWVAIEHEDGSTGYDLDPSDDAEDVKPELARYLRSGRSLATGVRDGVRRTINAVEWHDLRIVGRYEREGFATVMTTDGARDAYKSVRLSRDDLLAGFRAPGAIEPATKSRKPITVANARELLAREAAERRGAVLGHKPAEAFLNNLGYRGRENIRTAVDELTGGRSPGQR